MKDSQSGTNESHDSGQINYRGVMSQKKSLVLPCFIDDAGLAPALPPNWKTPEIPREPVVRNEFPDPEKLLETALGSLRRFMLAAIPFEFPVVLRKMDGDGEQESYELDINTRSAEIRAFDTEGMRRGIYALIREWRSNGSPELAPRKIRRAPWLKTRIARCCFGPIKRPPLNRDELMDDVNYYPDAYLERLASEGINALWLTVSFADLCTTRFTPGDGGDKVRRYAKLRQTVDRCRRYGIRIYVFCIEPYSWKSDSPVLKQFPSLGGPNLFGQTCFCPVSPEGKEYLYECMHEIFSSVKGLGGMINIAIGEGITTCLGSMDMNTDSDIQRCPRQCALKPGEIMGSALESMNRGMKDASPDSELIAWFYIPFIRKLPDTLKTLAETAPEEVVLQLNFESGAAVEQLGKKRVVGDYWQFIPEPSDVFDEFARLAKKSGRKVSAKIQTGCSHEIATVPHVPVPGLLYRKFAAMRKRGIAHAMLGWYFGTTPGLMNEAAGELAFLNTESVPEEQFLTGFARTVWGKEQSARAAEGWKIFSEACRNYPLSNMIQYFGPVADGVAWPLHLYPQDSRLLPTWLLNNGKVSGDNLCECLENHTLGEAVVLFGKLAEEWERGVRLFASMKDAFRNCPERLRDIGVAEALGIHFSTAADILRFYQLRRQFFQTGDPACLDEMKGIVGREIESRRKLLSLMKQDPRLGFHPEAEDYKYTAEGVGKSILQLRALLENEFSRPAEEILEREKKIPRGKESYTLGGGPLECPDFTWSAEIRDAKLVLQVFCPGQNPVMDEFYIGLDDMGRSFPWLMHADSSGYVYRISPDSECKVNRCNSGWKIHVTVPEQALPGGSFRDLRINLIRAKGSYANLSSWPLERTDSAARLNLIFYDPANMGILTLPSESGKVSPRQSLQP